MSRSPAPRPARRRAIALNPAQKSQLAAAQARCVAQGSQLTPLRTEVLSLLIRRGGRATSGGGPLRARHQSHFGHRLRVQGLRLGGPRRGPHHLVVAHVDADVVDVPEHRGLGGSRAGLALPPGQGVGEEDNVSGADRAVRVQPQAPLGVEPAGQVVRLPAPGEVLADVGPVADLSVLVRRIRGVRVVPAGEDHAHQRRGGDRVRGGAAGTHIRARQRRRTRRVRHQGPAGVDEGLGPGHDVVGGGTVRANGRAGWEPLRHGPLTIGQHDRDGTQRALGTRALHVVGQATAVAGRLVTEGGQGAGSPAGLRHLSDRIKCAAGGRLGRHRSHHGEAQRGRQHHRAGEADQPRGASTHSLLHCYQQSFHVTRRKRASTGDLHLLS